MDQSSLAEEMSGNQHSKLLQQNITALSYPGPLDQITAKSYLEQSVFPSIEQALNLLLETIEQNGEFEKYVDMLAERQEREQKELRRREKERKMLEMGDDYVSSGSEEEEDSEEGSDEYGESEVPSDQLSFVDSEYLEQKAAKQREETVLVDEGEQFNALRFLAMTLKDLKGTQIHN